MLPLAAATLLSSPVELRRAAKRGGGGGARAALAALLADCRGLLASPVCLLVILALSVYNGALGCYAFYGPKAARDIFSLPPETADLLFGGITVATGVAGTLSGGVALDALGPSVRNALMLCTGEMRGLCCPACCWALKWPAGRLPRFPLPARRCQLLGAAASMLP